MVDNKNKISNDFLRQNYCEILNFFKSKHTFDKHFTLHFTTERNINNISFFLGWFATYVWNWRFKRRRVRDRSFRSEYIMINVMNFVFISLTLLFQFYMSVEWDILEVPAVRWEPFLFFIKMQQFSPKKISWSFFKFLFQLKFDVCLPSNRDFKTFWVASSNALRW